MIKIRTAEVHLSLLSRLVPFCGEAVSSISQSSVILHVDRQIQASSAKPCVPIYLVEFLSQFGTIGLLAEIAEEVRLPILCADALSSECLDVIIHVWQENI